MRWLHGALISLMVVCASPGRPAAGGSLGAQQVGSETPRVHPELVDTTWGRRVMAAWQLAWASRWIEARQAFGALHEEQPEAVEPMTGLGLVARGLGRLREARNWYGIALLAEPSSADNRRERDLLEWQRPASIEIETGSTRVNGVATTDLSTTLVLPLWPEFELLARAGMLGAGEPLVGILPNAALPGTRSTVLGIGAVIRPSGNVTLTPRLEEWTTGPRHDRFLWLDGAIPLSIHFTALLGVRPLSGSTGAAQVSAGANLVIDARQVLTMQGVAGTRAAPFEARDELRAFYALTPTLRESFRIGLVRDLDPALSATTGVGSASYAITPWLVVRGDLSVRTGAFARKSFGLALVDRW
jgi:hypothetical protein